MNIGALLRGLLDLLAPLRCPGCDEVLEEQPGEEPPLDPFAQEFCCTCAPLIEPYPGPEALYEYGGPLAEAIKRLKYQGRLDTLPGLTRLVDRARADLVGEADLVVPVPLFRSRRVARGFNQSALLVAPLASALGVPLGRRALTRVRDTAPQAQLDAEGRERNVRGAFRAKPLDGERVLLFDDVHTTGATLGAAREALFEAGASEVITLSLAGKT
ncbi:MAG: ComF family protein [Sandaracinaceae bacterium]|nr:ComF family protein [Sandaracinaceae bacterium]